MKKLSLFLAIILSIGAFAQTEQFIGTANSLVRARGSLTTDSGIVLTDRDTTFWPKRKYTMVYRAQDSNVYVHMKTTGRKWDYLLRNSSAVSRFSPKIVSAVFSGTSPKTLTITYSDGTTTTGTFTDLSGSVLNAGNIAFGSGSNAVTGDSHFSYDPITHTLTIFAQGDNISKVLLMSFNTAYYTEIINNAGNHGDLVFNIGGDATGNQVVQFNINGVEVFKIKGNGQLSLAQSAAQFTDNAAALLGGLVAGDVYRTGDLLKIVH